MHTKPSKPKLLRSTFILLYLFLMHSTGFSQNYEISTMEVNNNNFSAYLNKILFEDKDGFLWYSTYNGIVREMGNNNPYFFKYNAPKDENIVQTNAIFQSSNNKIWACTAKGINVLDLKTGQSNWISATYPDTEKSVFFTSAKEDAKGNIWLGTDVNYLYCYTKNKKLTYTKIIKSDYSVKSRYQYPSGKMQIVDILDDNSIIIKQNNKWFRIINGLSGLILELEVTDLNSSSVLIPNNGLLPLNSSGSYTFKNQNYKYYYIKEIDKQIIEIPYDDAQFINKNTTKYFNSSLDFMSIDNKNLIGFKLKPSKQSVKLEEVEKINLKNKISNAIYNPYGQVWLETEYGISKIKNTQSGFKKYLNTQDTSCRSITEDDAGNIYILTYRGFFIKKKGDSKFEELKIIKDQKKYENLIRSSHAFYKLNNDELLFYGYTRFITKINIRTGHVKAYSSGSKKLSFTDITPLDHSKFLLASEKGLFEFDLNTEQFKDVSKINTNIDLTNKSVFAVYKTKDKSTLWIATNTDNTLIKIDKKNNLITSYNTKSTTLPLVNNTIKFIHEDDTANIWLGTIDGLQKINPKTNHYKNYTTSFGLKNDHIASLLEDKDNMWIGTFDGLVKLSKTTDAIQSFYTVDGLTHNEFNGKSHYKAKDGTLYLGSLNGLISFNAKSVLRNDNSHQLFLAEYQKYDKQSKANVLLPVFDNSNTQFNIPYQQNYITLKFAINDIYNSEKNSYQYHIKEISEDWVDLGNYSTVQFRGLYPGDYTLKVRGFSSNGNETNTLDYNIKISQIFYKKYWFILLNFLALILFFTIKNTRKRRRLKIAFEQKTKIQALEAKALRAQMNPHFIFNTLNGMQSVMILKGEREANKYFTAFSKLLRLTLDMNNTEYITLQDEIDYLNSYVALENLRLSDRLEFSFNIDDNLDLEALSIPCMLFQPIIENSLIHGLTPKQKDLKLTINFIKKGNYLIGEIIDNGIGREAAVKERTKKNYKSWATHIMNERIDISNSMMDEKIEWEIIDLKEEGKPLGTKVVLTIPLKEQSILLKTE